MRRLIFADNSFHVREMLVHLKDEKGEGAENIWIATSPLASYALGELGLPYQIPEDFLAQGELMELSRQWMKRMESFVEMADSFLFDNVRGLRERNITAFRFHTHPLFMVYSGVLFRIHQIKRVVDKLKPQEIWSHTSGDYPFGIYKIGFHKQENIWGKVLGLEEWGKEGVEVRLFHEPVNVEPPRFKERLKKYLVERWDLYEYSRISGALRRQFGRIKFVRYLFSILLGAAGIQKGRKNILMMSPLYDWIYAIGPLLSRGVSVTLLKKWRFKLASPAREDKKLTGRFEESVWVQDTFTWKGISFYPLLRTRIRYILNISGMMTGIHDSLLRYFKRLSAEVFCSSTRTEAEDFVACNAAQASGAKVVIMQHGGGGHYHLTLPYVEMINASYYFTFGTGIGKLYEEDCRKLGLFPVPVGSASIDEINGIDRTDIKLDKNLLYIISAARTSGEKVILYVTTALVLNNWYGSYEPPLSDYQLSEAQDIILDGLGGIRASRVLFKEYPSGQPLPWIEVIKRKYGEKIISVKRETTFSKFLNLSDLIVIDWPATTLFQAVMTDKPVFVLSSLLKLDPEALALLERRAVCCASPGELVSSVREYIETGEYKADASDTEFLKTYATYLNDGRSAERVTEETLNIMKLA